MSHFLEFELADVGPNNRELSIKKLVFLNKRRPIAELASKREEIKVTTNDANRNLSSIREALSSSESRAHSPKFWE